MADYLDVLEPPVQAVPPLKAPQIANVTERTDDDEPVVFSSSLLDSIRASY